MVSARTVHTGELRGVRFDLRANGLPDSENEMVAWRENVARVLLSVKGLDVPLDALHQLSELAAGRRGIKIKATALLREAAERVGRAFDFTIGVNTPLQASADDPEDPFEMAIRNLIEVPELRPATAITIVAREAHCAFSIYKGGLNGEGGWTNTVRGLFSFTRKGTTAARTLLAALNACDDRKHFLHRPCGTQWTRMPARYGSPAALIAEYC